MAAWVQVITGLPRWLLQQYLEQIGASAADEAGWQRAAGWQARVTQLEDYVIGSLRVGQVRLEVDGEATAVEGARAALAPKLLRAGG